jgi:16S rRNA (cytosine967-C5)-methyltransferase
VTTARLVALDAMVRIEDGAYAHVVLPAMLARSGLAPRDRAFVTDLVYSSVRSQRRLDDLIGRVASRPVRRLDAPVRAALRLGAYQLLAGVPRHAAVSATVDALGARSPRARGFTNGVLRAMGALGPPWPEPERTAEALSYPDWLVDRMEGELGADAAHDALRAMNEPASVTLRPNPRATTPDALQSELLDAGVTVERGTLVDTALVVRGTGDPTSLPAVREGRATPQDQGSQAVVDALDPRPGERIVDLAAAPGGKAGAAAERVGPDGLVVALDVDPGRVRLIAGARQRLGVGWLALVVGDARRPPLAAGTFDRVLLDAPCSGLGVLRRRPDARFRVTPQLIGEVAQLQRQLLEAAAGLVRAGGTLVYSVCTLTGAETVAVDQWAATNLGEFSAVDPPGAPWERIGRGARLLPQVAGTDGMYVLTLRRASATPGERTGA